jgi:hypothetical protein
MIGSVLNLNDSSRIGVSIFQVGDEILGKGTIIQRNNAERFGAFGSEDKDKLNLD